MVAVCTGVHVWCVCYVYLNVSICGSVCQHVPMYVIACHCTPSHVIVNCMPMCAKILCVWMHGCMDGWMHGCMDAWITHEVHATYARRSWRLTSLGTFIKSSTSSGQEIKCPCQRGFQNGLTHLTRDPVRSRTTPCNTLQLPATCSSSL